MKLTYSSIKCPRCQLTAAELDQHSQWHGRQVKCKWCEYQWYLGAAPPTFEGLFTFTFRGRHPTQVIIATVAYWAPVVWLIVEGVRGMPSAPGIRPVLLAFVLPILLIVTGTTLWTHLRDCTSFPRLSQLAFTMGPVVIAFAGGAIMWHWPKGFAFVLFLQFVLSLGLLAAFAWFGRIHLFSKQCGGCRAAVSYFSKEGQSCPFCQIEWQWERTFR